MNPLNQSPLKSRIKEARIHMQQYGGDNEALWPYRDFSLTVKELLDAAEPSPLNSYFPSIKEKLKKAYEHILTYKQENDSLWSYQPFSMNVGELLESAIFNFEPKFISEKRKEVSKLLEDYKNITSEYKLKF